jgi:hypothetical protein
MLDSEDADARGFATIMLTPCLTGHVPDAVLDVVLDA